jgi:hypothetical protein
MSKFVKNVSLLEKVKEHFNSININLNQPDLQNAVTTIYQFLDDEELLVHIVINALYPKSEFEWRNDGTEKDNCKNYQKKNLFN